MIKIKSCPFCGGNKLWTSVDGGCLPSYIDNAKRIEILKNTPYVTTCSVGCYECGVKIETYAASANFADDIYTKAIKNCYEKWNRKAEQKSCDECINKFTSICGNCKDYDEFEPKESEEQTD